MNRRLFEDLVVSTRGRRGGRGGLAFPASLGIHTAIVGGAVVLSALGPGELMPEVTARPQTLPYLPTVVHVVPRPAPVDSRPRTGGRGLRQGAFSSVPPRPAPVIADTAGEPEPSDVIDPDAGCPDPCLVGASVGDGPGQPGIPGADGDGSGPPSVVRAHEVAPPVKLRNVDPVYPELARRTRVEGVVIIECTIDPKGSIANARVLRGHPLLDAAAVEAVQQWVYTPSLVNGAPVSVIMTVTVHFTIAR